MDFKDKKVLIFGLGLLGGGVATTNWFLKQGTQVTVTDLKTEEQLKSSLEKINGEVQLKLGGHNENDIYANDVIVCNQDVSINNPYVQLAFKEGKQVETEGTLFFKIFPNKIIGITGTRGKTTTTVWTNTFLRLISRSTTVGNFGEVNPFMEIANKGDEFDIAVAEVPSFQLEYFGLINKGPEIAVITNLSADHLNRHGDMKNYALVKANISKYQTPNQHLILNYDNEWTEFFISQKPQSHIWRFSKDKLPGNIDGLYYQNNEILFQEKGGSQSVLSVGDFIKEEGVHNLENLLASSLVAYLAGVPWDKIQTAISSLPQIEFRQEIVFKNKKLMIINDTTATSPEGTIQAIKRFGGLETILIIGGTDKDLNFTELGKVIPEFIRPDNIVFLTGSATDKIRTVLGDFAHDCPSYDSLRECVEIASKKASQYPQSVILFSPASKSFEKFKNEYDRGEQFNNLIKDYYE